MACLLKSSKPLGIIYKLSGWHVWAAGGMAILKKMCKHILLLIQVLLVLYNLSALEPEFGAFTGRCEA